MNDDVQHLRLLSTFHYVVAGITALMGCFPIIYLILGIALLTGRLPAQPQPNSPVPDAFVGWVFVVAGCAAMIAMWSIAVLLLFAARFLKARRHHTFCIVVAGLECMMMPFGTVLGIFTIIVLVRPAVLQLFGADQAE